MANTKIPVELSSTPGIVDNSNATAITIDSSENVGIGTSSPSYPLEVRTSSDTEISAIRTGSVRAALGAFTSGESRLTSAGTSSFQTFYTGSTPAERMRIDSSGNVGIGKSNPVAELDVFASSTPAVRVADGSGFNVKLEAFGSNAAGLVCAGAATNMTFQTNETERMRIDTLGNVGIGTSSPDSKLHIFDGGSSVNNTITFGNPSATAKAEIHHTAGGSEFLNISCKGTTSGFGNIVFNTGLTPDERMRIDASGNVGIGTTSPQSALHIAEGGSGSDGGSVLTLSQTGFGSIVNNDDLGSVHFGGVTSGGVGIHNAAKIMVEGDATWASNDYPTRMSFFTTADGASSATERMRIDSSGNLLVGTTSNYATSNGQGIQAQASSNACITASRTTDDGACMRFYRDTTLVGSISVTSSATTYNTSSDARLKDVTGEARGLEVINELNPVAYNWKADGKADEGLIAQEVLDVVPNAVSGSEEEMYQMDYSKLVTPLIKAIQEQQEQIEALQSEINLLKGE